MNATKRKNNVAALLALIVLCCGSLDQVKLRLTRWYGSTVGWSTSAIEEDPIGYAQYRETQFLQQRRQLEVAGSQLKTETENVELAIDSLEYESDLVQQMVNEYATLTLSQDDEEVARLLARQDAITIELAAARRNRTDLTELQETQLHAIAEIDGRIQEVRRQQILSLNGSSISTPEAFIAADSQDESPRDEPRLVSRFNDAITKDRPSNGRLNPIQSDRKAIFAQF